MQLAKISIDPKYFKLTADVVRIMIFKKITGMMFRKKKIVAFLRNKLNKKYTIGAEPTGRPSQWMAAASRILQPAHIVLVPSPINLTFFARVRTSILCTKLRYDRLADTLLTRILLVYPSTKYQKN